MVKSFLDYMTPEHCNVTLMAKELEELCTAEEKYYKVKYCMEDFDEKLMLNLQSKYKEKQGFYYFKILLCHR